MRKTSLRRLTSISFVIAVVLALTAVPAFAGKGGGGPNKVPPTIEVVQALTADAGVAAASYTINGEGFKGRTAVFLVFTDGTLPLLVETDRSGSFTTGWNPKAAGSINIDAYQLAKKSDWDFATSTIVDIG